MEFVPRPDPSTNLPERRSSPGVGETLAVADAGGAPLAEAGPPSAAGISVQNGEPNPRTPICISRREQSALILAGLLLLANSPREHMIEWSLEGSPQNTDLTMPRLQMV